MCVLAQRFIHDPYATTFGGFSKVTNFFKAALKPPGSPGHFRTAQDPSLPHQCDEEPGFELINCVRDDDDDNNNDKKSNFDGSLSGVCLSAQGVALGPRPDVTRGEPLDQWDEFLDPEGRVKNPEKIKELVFRGVRQEKQRRYVCCEEDTRFTLVCVFVPRVSHRSCGRRCGSSSWAFTRGTAPPRKERTSCGSRRECCCYDNAVSNTS